MYAIRKQNASRGFSFVELLIGAAIFSLVFGALFLAIKYSINLIGLSKAASGARALANERLEYVRSLTYANAGTIGGIPNGPIPQTSTTSLNGIVYHERVLIQYVDSPDDGVGGADANGILADYKQVKVELSWSGINGTTTIALVSNIVPPGIESTLGGGTLRVNVFDAAVQPVSGAEVHIYNDTTTSTIDTMKFTNASGEALFSGAPAAANYQITVDAIGMSTDQTYSASSSNPNPLPQHVAVIESAVSTMNFQIDALSDLTINTVGPSTDGSSVDPFDDLNNTASSSNVASVGGELVLAGGAGAYAASGSVISTTTAPGAIDFWDVIDFGLTIPVNTILVVHVYEETSPGVYALIPDGVLPGNSGGFTTGPIDISSIDTGTYPALALGATLGTADPFFTPAIDDWAIHYVVSEPNIGSVPVTLTSSKTVGTTASATPVYKYQQTHTTNGSGEVTVNNLEWDLYDVTLGTGIYDIAEACEDVPYSLEPGVTETLRLTLVPSNPLTLRVSVIEVGGNPVIDAAIDLTRAGFSDSAVSTSCGQVFFNAGLAAASDYQVDVIASGYASETITDIEVDGDNTLVVTLAP